jgi:2'-5' RNA ligase
MSSLVVVAIPADDDQVWKVSSEKVPHLTLLYLGDSNTVDNVDSIAEFLDHAASTSLNRFGLDVDRRGVLGGDQADVLFFSAGWEAKEVKQFRHYLLQNDDIRTAYDSSEQHPDWLPHLTLGYPETPAKPNPNDYGIGWVRFDRIALWLGDYEGPEFVLQRSNDYAEVSMSDAVENVLAHYGKKGMKWGVRRDPQTGARPIAVSLDQSKFGKVSKANVDRYNRKKGYIDNPKKPSSSDAKRADKAVKKAKKKGLASLSNEELQALNQRLNLEQQYSNLTKNKTNVATARKGHNAVKEILAVGITAKTAYDLAKSPAAQALAKKLTG